MQAQGRAARGGGQKRWGDTMRTHRREDGRGGKNAVRWMVEYAHRCRHARSAPARLLDEARLQHPAGARGQHMLPARGAELGSLGR